MLGRKLFWSEIKFQNFVWYSASKFLETRIKSDQLQNALLQKNVHLIRCKSIRRYKQNQTVWLLHCPSKGYCPRKMFIWYVANQYEDISKTKLSDYYIVLAKDLSVPERYTMKIAAKSVIWIWYAMLVKLTLLNALAPEEFFSGLFCWVYLIWLQIVSVDAVMVTWSCVATKSDTWLSKVSE